jgi:diguanylate cyclase (GGDEF)-like protein
MWMEIQRLETDLVRLATIDGLTGILNRRAFLDASEREISRCNRSGETFGFAMFDLDWFKRVNDNYGHPVGDKVLRLFADTLRSVVRPHDFLSRYGGEEFALVMPGIDKAAACAIVERCRQAVERRSIEHDGRPIKVTVSAGVTAFGEDGSDLETLIKAADAALYRAKRSGRNRAVAASSADLDRDPARPSSFQAQ